MSFLSFLSTIPGLGPFSLRCSDSEPFSLVCLMCEFQTIIEQKDAITVFSGSYAMNHQFLSSQERSEDISTSTQPHQRQIGFLLSSKFQQHVRRVLCWCRILVELPQEVIFSKSNGCKRKGVPCFGAKLCNCCFFRFLERSVAWLLLPQGWAVHSLDYRPADLHLKSTGNYAQNFTPGMIVHIS